jgi:hypothetical protein
MVDLLSLDAWVIAVDFRFLSGEFWISLFFSSFGILVFFGLDFLRALVCLVLAIFWVRS